MIRRAGRAGNGGLEVTQDYRIGLKDYSSSFLRGNDVLTLYLRAIALGSYQAVRSRTAKGSTRAGS